MSTALPTMEDEFDLPEALQKAADKYRKDLEKKNKATSTLKSSKDALIAMMEEEGLTKVRVLDSSGNLQQLVLTETKAVKVKEVKDDMDSEVPEVPEE